VRAGQKAVQDDNVMQVDDSDDEFLFKPSRKATREAKRAIAVARIPLSPTKINTNFKVTKPAFGKPLSNKEY
jgi:hypothetical protein